MIRFADSEVDGTYRPASRAALSDNAPESVSLLLAWFSFLAIVLRLTHSHQLGSPYGSHTLDLAILAFSPVILLSLEAKKNSTPPFSQLRFQVSSFILP
jgi:hypothetical protein